MKFPIAAALIAVVLFIIGLGAWWMMVPGPLPAPEENEPVAAVEAEDEESIADRDVMAKQALEANCQVCHEMRMITTMRLTPAQWKAEVDKMVNWGAVASEGERELITEYLARHYPADAPRSPVELIALASVQSPELADRLDGETIEGDPAEGQRLYKTLCAACHGPTALGGDLGPRLANRAIIGHAAAYDEIVRKGLRRMPPFETVLNAQQQRDILVWLRDIPRDVVAQTSR